MSKPNAAIKAMMAVPGIYETSDERAWKFRLFARVEVTTDGRVFQLNQDLERDGLLAEDNWHDDAIVIRRLTLRNTE